MRPSHWLFLLRAASLVALAVSVALLLDYLSPEMAFCSAESGCGAVRDSGLGYVKLPSGYYFPYLPALGLLNFAALFASSLMGEAEIRRRVTGALALSGGVLSLVLLGLQALLLGRYCSLCVVVDVGAVIAAVAAILLRGDGWQRATKEEQSESAVESADSPLSEGQRVQRTWQEDSQIYDAPNPLVLPPEREPLHLKVSAWLMLGAIALLAPLCYTSVARTEEVPAAIHELYQPGQVNVVEFFDYQCPHCRIALPELNQALVAFGKPVHVVKQPVTLPGHELGRRAGRLHVCAAEQGKDIAVMRALLEGGPELTEAQLLAAGVQKELDPQKLVSCLESERPDQALKRTTSRLERAGFVGLPTTYIGETRLLGGQPYEMYLDALSRAASGADQSGLPPRAYWALIAGLVVFVAAWGRKRRRQVVRTRAPS